MVAVGRRLGIPRQSVTRPLPSSPPGESAGRPRSHFSHEARSRSGRSPLSRSLRLDDHLYQVPGGVQDRHGHVHEESSMRYEPRGTSAELFEDVIVLGAGTKQLPVDQGFQKSYAGELDHAGVGGDAQTRHDVLARQNRRDVLLHEAQVVAFSRLVPLRDDVPDSRDVDGVSLFTGYFLGEPPPPQVVPSRIRELQAGRAPSAETLPDTEWSIVAALS